MPALPGSECSSVVCCCTLACSASGDPPSSGFFLPLPSDSLPSCGDLQKEQWMQHLQLLSDAVFMFVVSVFVPSSLSCLHPLTCLLHSCSLQRDACRPRNNPFLVLARVPAPLLVEQEHKQSFAILSEASHLNSTQQSVFLVIAFTHLQSFSWSTCHLL